VQDMSEKLTEVGIEYMQPGGSHWLQPYFDGLKTNLTSATPLFGEVVNHTACSRKFTRLTHP